MIELKPCPFCGGKNAYIATTCYVEYYVRCPDCGAVAFGKDTDEMQTDEKAAEVWNRRANE